jgi:hypothetical protein
MFVVVVLNRLVVGLCLFPLLGSYLARNGMLLAWFLFQLVVGGWFMLPCWLSVSLIVPYEMCSDFFKFVSSSFGCMRCFTYPLFLQPDFGPRVGFVGLCF